MAPARRHAGLTLTGSGSVPPPGASRLETNCFFIVLNSEEGQFLLCNVGMAGDEAEQQEATVSHDALRHHDERLTDITDM